ncbi:MAG TPA: hypothetical protein VFD60_11435 [Nitrososphaeraceae archaeon]|nr:hypothetical protein [Nitrososphaeraceae archaeon]
MKFPDYLQTAQTMIDSFHANIEYIKQLSSTNNHFAKRFALESGADKVIDYKTENFEDIIMTMMRLLILLVAILTKGPLKY